jgi:hypothetical protein
VTFECKSERAARRVARVFEALDLGDNVTVSGGRVTADRAGKLTPEQWQAIIEMIFRIISMFLG